MGSGVAKWLGLTAAVATNPEQLFAAHAGIGQIPGGFCLDIDFYVPLPSREQDEAQSLVDAAHQVCPYSNATRGNVDVRLHITV